MRPELSLELARLIEAHPGGKVSVRASRSATLLDNGEIVTERDDMAHRGREKITDPLIGLGVLASSIDCGVVVAAKEPTGTPEWQSRRVEVTLSAIRQGWPHARRDNNLAALG